MFGRSQREVVVDCIWGGGKKKEGVINGVISIKYIDRFTLNENRLYVTKVNIKIK